MLLIYEVCSKFYCLVLQNSNGSFERFLKVVIQSQFSCNHNKIATCHLCYFDTDNHKYGQKQQLTVTLVFPVKKKSNLLEKIAIRKLQN